MNILREAQKQGKLQEYDIARAGGTFNEVGFKMKVSITKRRTDADRARVASTSTTEVVTRGLATPGTPVICRIRGGAAQRGEIVKANRTRYVVKGIGGKYDGQEFTFPFMGTRLDTTPATA